jgi:hypothetical protein
MSKTWLFAVLATAVCAGPAAVHADVWDLQSDNDDGTGSDNELLHGVDQQHDLGVRPGPVADQDWYLMPQKRQASYEVIIDGVSGDLGFSGLSLERIRVAGTTTTQLQVGDDAVDGSFGYSRSLRWMNTTSTTVTDEMVRVAGAACGTACGSEDVYTIHARETTVNLARFNASGSQATILLTQNASERPVNATFFYWSPAGTLLQTGTLSLASKALNVFNVATFPALAGQSGHITVIHDGTYGALNIKSVALEPATGFSFDTPGVYVPH